MNQTQRRPEYIKFPIQSNTIILFRLANASASGAFAFLAMKNLDKLYAIEGMMHTIVEIILRWLN